MQTHIRHTCLTLLIAGLLFVQTGFSQDFYQQFKSLSFKKDSAKQFTLLRDWAKTKPKDPERYVCAYNYHVQKSMREVVSLGRDPGRGDNMQLTDSNGKVAGYLADQVWYEQRQLDTALGVIDEGIKLYPDRLDMRFGKVYILGEARRYKEFAQEIIAATDYGSAHEHKWKWSEGKAKDSAREFFLETVQSYMNTLYNSGDAQLPLLRQVSETILKYELRHIESMSNIAVSYIVAGEPEKGLPYLLRAEEINPQDAIVLNNIAEVYSRKKEKVKAIEYYNRVIKYGDEEIVEYARGKIKELE